MSKHKHAEMIKAKADNMDLVVFCYSPSKDEFRELPNNYLPDTSPSTYFLCLPQHKEACLHWLNGGEARLVQGNINTDIVARNGIIKWSIDSIFMCESCEIQIKPKKEKRWIAVYPDTWATTKAYPTKEDCFNQEFYGCKSYTQGWQFIEIEVEA